MLFFQLGMVNNRTMNKLREKFENEIDGLNGSQRPGQYGHANASLEPAAGSEHQCSEDADG